MRIALLGDIAFFGKNTAENEAYKKRFYPLKQLLDACDYVIGNLETPLTRCDRTIGGKSAYIKGSPEDVELLKYLGVTHVSLANNHTFDYRKQGFAETKTVLEGNGIIWYGAEGKHAEISTPDGKIRIYGYCCYSTNGKGMNFVNPLDPRVIEEDLSQSEGAIPVLSVHWGQEHVHYPNYDHVELARRLAKGHSFVIHGHHPHVIQGIEQVGDSLIAYSLGNVCFDDVYTSKSREPLIRQSPDNQEMIVLVLNVENNSIKAHEAIPFSFTGEEYRRDDTITSKLNEWSAFLSAGRQEYLERRSQDLTEYLQDRKKKRDLQWYVKRLNLESARQLMDLYSNANKYRKLITSYLDASE